MFCPRLLRKALKCSASRCVSAGAGPAPEGADLLEGQKTEVWGCFLRISLLKS